MPKRKPVALLLVTAAVATLSGCATFSDRFQVPGRDPLLTLLGAEYEGQREWPAAQLPTLRPMLPTELIPDRRAPPGEPPLNWPPL